MSIHVQRAEPSRASLYILVFGFLCALGAFIYDSYREPKTLNVKATPETAKLYIDGEVVCEALPCEITVQYWPKVVRVVADRHYSQVIPISIFEYFSSNLHSHDINLKPFPYRAPEPKIIIEETAPPLPQSEIMPKRKYSDPQNVPKPTTKANIPMKCRETSIERKQIQNRPPILCYSEDDKAVQHDTPGECYASYWVSVKGRAQKLQGFGCMHDEPLEAAKLAFKNRIYLPGLKNGKLVEKAVEAEIKYGAKSAISGKGDLSSNTTLNRDARVLACPSVTTPKSMVRSGHCIFEFDLSKEGSIAQIRQTRCTHARLTRIMSSAFQQCKFIAAKTDGVAVERPFMKYQIDVDVYDSQGQKIPVHASFGEASVNKPYIINQ